MLYLVCLLFATGAVVAVLLRSSAKARRRNQQSWESIVSRFQPDWTIPDLDQSASPEERWQQLGGAHGLWAMYQNAKVMLEMADYAARNTEAMDAELLANLRSDALQIRVLVAGALAKYALHQLNEGISSNVYRAASLYREMTGRMTGLLPVNAGALAPQYLGVH